MNIEFTINPEFEALYQEHLQATCKNNQQRQTAPSIIPTLHNQTHDMQSWFDNNNFLNNNTTALSFDDNAQSFCAEFDPEILISCCSR